MSSLQHDQSDHPTKEGQAGDLFISNMAKQSSSCANDALITPTCINQEFPIIIMPVPIIYIVSFVAPNYVYASGLIFIIGSY